MKTFELPSCSFTSGIDTIYESDPDDENLSHFDNSGLRERRRKLHTEAEQRRRNAIKKGFDRLVELLNPVKNKHSSAVRMNKSIILHKSISKVQKLMKLRDQKVEEYQLLDKKFQALHAFYSNYEKISQEKSNVANTESIPEEIKLRVFQMFSDHLFSSFEPTTTVASYDVFCRSVIEWLEENCKPERLSPLMDSVLACTSLPSRSQETDCPSNTMPHLDTFIGPEWLDGQRTGDNVGMPTNLRTMVLDDRLSSGIVDSEAVADQQLIRRPCSMTFAVPNQCVGDLQPSFAEPNSSSSIGTCLSSSDLFGHIQFQTDFASPNNPPTTDSAATTGTTHNTLHCVLSAPSGNDAQQSINELQFHSDKLDACGSQFLFQNFTIPCNDTHNSHGFHTNQSRTRAAPSVVGGAHNELCGSFDHLYPLPYL